MEVSYADQAPLTTTWSRSTGQGEDWEELADVPERGWEREVGLGVDPVASVYEGRMHSVRSSLEAISGAVRVLSPAAVTCSGEKSGQQGMYDMRLAEVERLGHLVSAPVVVERPEPVELDLDTVMDHVVLGRRAAGQHVTWTPTGARAVARRNHVMEVLNLLLVNAEQHAPAGKARITVTDDGGSVRLSVTDTGPGVPPHLREAVFHPGTRRLGSPGHGLGLAAARELVEALGGSLALVPTDARGACFSLVLPGVRTEPT
jgi:signal transduction histidine kinase